MALVTRTALDPGSAEYKDIAKGLKKKHQWALLSIEKVHNASLEERFLEMKQQYQDKYGKVKIVKGWHGTKQVNVDSILRTNFDVNRHGQNRGHRFGAGVSFSSLSSYASNYCDKRKRSSETEASLLLADVLVSNYIVVPEVKDKQQVLSEPPLLPGSSSLHFDTTARNDRMHVFVKFEPDTFLPIHVLRFKRPRLLPTCKPFNPFTALSVTREPREV